MVTILRLLDCVTACNLEQEEEHDYILDLTETYQRTDLMGPPLYTQPYLMGMRSPKISKEGEWDFFTVMSIKIWLYVNY